MYDCAAIRRLFSKSYFLEAFYFNFQCCPNCYNYLSYCFPCKGMKGLVVLQGPLPHCCLIARGRPASTYNITANARYCSQYRDITANTWYCSRMQWYCSQMQWNCSQPTQWYCSQIRYCAIYYIDKHSLRPMYSVHKRAVWSAKATNQVHVAHFSTCGGSVCQWHSQECMRSLHYTPPKPYSRDDRYYTKLLFALEILIRRDSLAHVNERR